MSELEDTIDRATLLLLPYRGKLASYEIFKNISGSVLLIVVIVVGIAIGLSTENWLYCALIIAAFIVAFLLTIYFSKIAYHKKLRQSHFLLSVFCRAENNRHYLNLGLELRPGYLGKWIQLSVINIGDHTDAISHFKYRFLKPAIDYRTKQAEQDFLNDKVLLQQQILLRA